MDHLATTNGGTVFKRPFVAMAEGDRPSAPRGEAASATSWVTSKLKIYPYNPDDLVRAKGKGLKIYQDMAREPYIKAALHQKKARLLKVGWEIVPYSKSPLDVEIAAFVRWNLETRLAGTFTGDLYGMLDGLNNGFSVMEKVYGTAKRGPWARKVVIDNIKSKDPYFFDFETDEFGNLGRSGLVLNNYRSQKKHLRVDKFVIFSYLSRYENFYGDSDLRAAYRAFWLKDTAWKLRAVYMERYAGNNLKGTYPKNDDAAKDKLIEIFQTWQQETGIALPEGLDVEVLQLATSSKSEYEATINDCNREIQIGILGQTLTMDVGTRGTGSRALGQVHDGVRDDFVWFLDETLASEVNLQIVRPLVDYNYDTVNYPWWTFKNREGFDGEKFSRTLLNLGKVRGLDIPVRWVKGKYRIPEPEADDEVVEVMPEESGGAAPGPGPSPPAPVKMAEEPAAEPKGPYWRELDRFELFAEIPRVDKETAALVEEAKEASVPVYEEIKKSISLQVERRKIIEGGEYSAIEKVTANVGGLKDLLAGVFLRASVMGRADAAKFAGKAMEKLAEEDFTPDKALAALARKAGLTKKEFDALAEEMKGRAITVAGLEKAAIEKDVKTLLLQAIKNGDDIKAFRFRLNEAFIKYSMPVYGGVGEAGDSILDFHAETVFRTNVMDAYNQGRKEGLEDPDVVEGFPAWRISEILDARTRAEHAAADGLTFMADDPVWSRITPPNGYNCRGVLVPISGFDFTRDMLSSPGDIPAGYPASGFGG